MGSTIDSSLVNHKFAQFQRHLLGIEGKSGHIPNPFSGTHVLKDDPTQKVQIRFDENNKSYPYVVPKINRVERNGKIESVNVVIDATDEHKIDQIISSIAKRAGVPIESVQIGNISNQPLDAPEVNVSLVVDLHDFKIGLLKIAYEFAVDSINEYYTDDHAIQISKILHQNLGDEVHRYVRIGDGFDHHFFSPFNDLLDFESKKHYLILVSTDDGLTCLVKLHKLFSIGIFLSPKNYLNDGLLFGINDIEQRTFYKMDPFELIDATHEEPQVKLQYLFEDQNSADEFLLLQNDADFDHFRVDGDIPFFDSSGNQIGQSVFQYIDSHAGHIAMENLISGGTVARIEVGKNFYIKVLPSNKLLRVIRLEQVRRRIKKL